MSKIQLTFPIYRGTILKINQLKVGKLIKKDYSINYNTWSFSKSKRISLDFANATQKIIQEYSEEYNNLKKVILVLDTSKHIVPGIEIGYEFDEHNQGYCSEEEILIFSDAFIIESITPINNDNYFFNYDYDYEVIIRPIYSKNIIYKLYNKGEKVQ